MPASKTTSSGKSSQQKKKQDPMVEEANATLKRLQQKDPGLNQFLKDAHGYAIFPTVGKAALVVGGAYGRGVVFERGKFIGYATVGQTTIGVQVGGDTFSQIIAFENGESLERFKKGKMAFAANASAVLVKAGAAATANYEKGVSVLAYAKGGMLLEAAIGGQKFNFKPASQKPGDQQKGEDGGANEQAEGSSGIAGRAMKGLKGAASKVTTSFKEHPVRNALIGTGLAATALIARRALRAGGGAGGSSAQRGEEQGETQSDDNGQGEGDTDDGGGRQRSRGGRQGRTDARA